MAIDLGDKTVLKNYCGGRWVEPSSQDRVDVWDPATGDVIARTPLSNAHDLDSAVDAAEQAFELWSEEPPPRRARIMFALQRLLQDNLEELAELIVLENGKGIDEARGDVQRGLEVVEFAAGAPTLLMGSGLEESLRSISRR
jgi:malonate-semialdehyde dehydrogenase (acetylating)/methylmalonate-semialdehyde dehydrogenase